MLTIKESENLLQTTYFKKGIIGVEAPGDSIVNFSLVICADDGIVSGIVEITKSEGTPNIKLNVAGTIRSTGYGKITNIINVVGEYMVSAAPPAIGSYLQKFSAYLDIDKDWNGLGGFTYGSVSIHNVLVTPVV